MLFRVYEKQYLRLRNHIKVHDEYYKQRVNNIKLLEA